MDEKPKRRARSQHVEISLAGIQDKDALHNLLAARLGFPQYYGKNWDAFWDAIGDAMPERLTFRNWSDLESVLPHEAKMLAKCLADLEKDFQELRGAVEYL